METRTFEVRCYLCSSGCFLSLSSGSAHPAAFCPPSSGGGFRTKACDAAGGSELLPPHVCPSASVPRGVSGSVVAPRLGQAPWRPPSQAICQRARCLRGSCVLHSLPHIRGKSAVCAGAAPVCDLSLVKAGSAGKWRSFSCS